MHKSVLVDPVNCIRTQLGGIVVEALSDLEASDVAGITSGLQALDLQSKDTVNTNASLRPPVYWLMHIGGNANFRFSGICLVKLN